MDKVKNLFLVIMVILIFGFTGCATIAHKNVTTTWQGYGVSVYYKSDVAINAKDIPAFIRAVDKLERLLKGE